MKPRTILLILLALICGVSAAVGVNQLNRDKAPVATGETVSVVCTSKDLARGEVLSPENCEIRQLPKESLLAGTIQDLEEVVDQTLAVPLVKGEAVLETKLSGKAPGQDLISRIPSGMRAFTIKTPHVASGVGGFIRPDSKVDVLLTTRSNSRSDASGGGATTTLIQNLKILAVDRRIDSPEGEEIDEKDPRSVTLLVTPNQAAKLDLGMNMGMLHLSLRNPDDNQEAKTRPATLAELRYHQEKPVTNMANRASELASRMARIWAGSGDTTETASAEPVEPQAVQYRSANIRTLRGSSRGHIRIDSAQ
jgi:pilus assembly protein CpaB